MNKTIKDQLDLTPEEARQWAEEIRQDEIRTEALWAARRADPNYKPLPRQPELLSNCCGASRWGHTDLCSDCLEHCEFSDEDE